MKYFFIMFLSSFIIGQVSSVWLLVSPSATSNGLGSCGVSANLNDVYSSFSNPAHSNLPDGFSFQSSNITTNWLPALTSDIYLQSNVKKISYSGNKIFKNNKFDLQLSISLLDLDFDLGEVYLYSQYSTEVFRNYNLSQWKNFSFGIKFKEYPFYFSIGYTDKQTSQQLVINTVDGAQNFRSDFYDLGLRFVIDDYSYKDVLGLTYSLGYSKSNIGDFVSFIDGQLGDPAPTVARFGMSLGFNLKPFENNNWMIAINHFREAEDLLIKTMAGLPPTYDKSLLGDINIRDHIFSNNKDEGIIIRRGNELNFFNIYYTRTGKVIDVEGNINMKTKGYGFNYSKSAKLTLLFLDKIIVFKDNFVSNINQIFNIVDIQKNYSKYHTDPGAALYNIEFEEITFSLNYIF